MNVAGLTEWITCKVNCKLKKRKEKEQKEKKRKEKKNRSHTNQNLKFLLNGSTFTIKFK